MNKLDKAIILQEEQVEELYLMLAATWESPEELEHIFRKYKYAKGVLEGMTDAKRLMA